MVDLSRIKKKTGLMSVAWPWGLCQDQARKDYVGQEWFSMTEARLLTNQRVVAELRTVNQFLTALYLTS